jgi:hypothetical protein
LLIEAPLDLSDGVQHCRREGKEYGLLELLFPGRDRQLAEQVAVVVIFASKEADHGFRYFKQCHSYVV